LSSGGVALSARPALLCSFIPPPVEASERDKCYSKNQCRVAVYALLEPYSPQPYEQLASVFQTYGDTANAIAIRYAGRTRERQKSTGIQRAWLTALDLVIGYGYYPQRAILWALGLVGLGAVVLRLSGAGPINHMPFGVAYSFDMLLPLVKLRERHYQIDLVGWPRYYFYAHKIAGYVLAYKETDCS